MLAPDKVIEEKIVSAITAAAEIFIPLGDLVDLQKEHLRLQKEFDNLSGEIAKSQGKLKNEGFLNKAPEGLIRQEKQKLEDNVAMLNSLKQRLNELSD